MYGKVELGVVKELGKVAKRGSVSNEAKLSIFTESAPRQIQSISHDVCVSCPVLPPSNANFPKASHWPTQVP